MVKQKEKERKREREREREREKERWGEKWRGYGRKRRIGRRARGDTKKSQ